MTGFDYLATMSEAQLQNQVIRLAETFGWSWYHTHDSRRSPAGFPDLVLARDGWLIFAELKRQGQSPTKKQQEWLSALGAVNRRTGWVTVAVWHPQDLPRIQTMLRSGWKVQP
jgi:hypothetical protein